MGGAQYRWGNQYRRGYHEYHGGISWVPWGCSVPWGDIMINVEGYLELHSLQLRVSISVPSFTRWCRVALVRVGNWSASHRIKVRVRASYLIRAILVENDNKSFTDDTAAALVDAKVLCINQFQTWPSPPWQTPREFLEKANSHPPAQRECETPIPVAEKSC